MKPSTAINQDGPDAEYDVVVVGFGPIGQLLSALLGRAGHKVGVFEPHLTVYDLPRAVRFDGEAMRSFQRLGIVDEIDHEVLPVPYAELWGADGKFTLTLVEGPHPSGHAGSYSFFQPVLETALDRAACTQPNVDVCRGWAAEKLVQHDEWAELVVRPWPGEGKDPRPGDLPRTVTARYVVGADGANSFVRQASGIERVDLGFSERWIIADLRPHDMSEFEHLYMVQFCDPTRPTTIAPNGRTLRRWEFMLLEGERAEDFLGPEDRVWELLAPYIRQDQGELVRQASYEFRSLLASTMRQGRVLLAGDAAHLMPPFIGEGMCSGLRDVANLAWKLDFVLRGLAPDALLDTYHAERFPQNMAVVEMAVALGRVCCVLDPQEAAERDIALRAGQPPMGSRPGIGEGVRRSSADDPLAGSLAVQPCLDGPWGTALADDALGTGFGVVTTLGDPRAVLRPDQLEFLDLIGAYLVTLDPTVPGAVRDSDGRFTDWLASAEVQCVVTRPDGYTFGCARTVDELPALIAELRERLTTTRQAVGPGLGDHSGR